MRADTAPRTSRAAISMRMVTACEPVGWMRAAMAFRGPRLMSMMATATKPRTYWPVPAARPTAAVAHRLAAVVRPWMMLPWWMIAPAPRKPTPVTIWAAIRVGSGAAAMPWWKASW